MQRGTTSLVRFLPTLISMPAPNPLRRSRWLIANAACVNLVVAGGCAPTPLPVDAPDPTPAPAPAAAPETSEAQPPRGGSLIPVRFDHIDLVLRDQHRFDDPRLGTRLTYAQTEPALRVDVYVYPMAPTNVEVPDSVRTELVRRMYERGKEDIRVYEELGRYADVTFDPDRELRFDTPDGPVDGWGTRAEMIAREEEVDSHLVLVGAGNLYVKFRATHPGEDDERASTVASFVEAFLGGMRAAPPPSPAHSASSG
jgi:hypothetical protein